MRFLLLLLFVSTVLTEEQIKNADKKIENKTEAKSSVDDTKSKTGKRDSADQTGAFGINPNDAPFKPMLNSPAPFIAAASDPPQVYYDKNHVTAGEGAGNVKVGTNPQAASAYRAQYSQVTQQQQQLNKNHLRVNTKNLVIQQQHNQPNILYADPQNPAYHYERTPQQQQQQIPLQAPSPLPLQRGQQKQIQYIIAIPMTYLRQLQQQVLHQQQQEQQSNLQAYKGQQQPQYQQQQQLHPLAIPVPVYQIGGPLARDHQGSYRPFHRFTLPVVNDVSTGTQHQTGPSSTIPQPLVPSSPATPAYTTQYVQIPVNVLLSAMQSAQAQQQQQHQQQHQQQQQQRLPATISTSPQQLYQQHPQPQIQLHLQQPIQQQQQQQLQTQSPPLYYYQPQQQQQVQLKHSQPSHALTSPPVYGYHVNQLQQQHQQQQQPYQQNQHLQHLSEQQLLNVGKQTHRIRGVRPTGNIAPNHQFDSALEAYESEEKTQIVTLQAPPHTNLNAHTHTNAQSPQYLAQAPIVRQQQPAPAHQVVQLQPPESYEPVVHYNPQYVQHYQEQPQPPHQHHNQPPQLQRQPHRLQLPTPQHSPFVEHLNNLPYSQGIHGPTPLPYLRLPTVTGESSVYNLNAITPQVIPQPFISGAFQPSFAPLGLPSKVTSFSNVVLQPFVGHPSAYQTPEIGTAVAGSAESIPYLHSNGGIRYGTHLYHPPTSATTILAGSKQHNSASHPEAKISASSAKSSVAPVANGSPTIVKYP